MSNIYLILFKKRLTSIYLIIFSQGIYTKNAIVPTQKLPNSIKKQNKVIYKSDPITYYSLLNQLFKYFISKDSHMQTALNVSQIQNLIILIVRLQNVGQNLYLYQQDILFEIFLQLNLVISDLIIANSSHSINWLNKNQSNLEHFQINFTKNQSKFDLDQKKIQPFSEYFVFEQLLSQKLI
ncbi:hypothetical protein TTHERM_000670349 (macronuclear) [Tetrahymena thermophila SB210]|uniref:Uncharacterized protein n=1 Tax=Tetrahymena thermophila (strain SB210) TaxID=312017 RepID=W7X1A1_TETTS|nr:hypothetical protein TTHERM_000670349 [Tetrahymena thermophila SB210]EWS71347.1 hypothetical protein TTHERM_000670349 [Tetrahymena thermophila SB210]|eukprot:XP_012656121.1 hypothetical protein TTHERM_000670349 [Tetrahymena thermophila SB210]